MTEHRSREDASLQCHFFFFQAEDGIRDYKVTGVQTCALPISPALIWLFSIAANAASSLSNTRAAPRKFKMLCPATLTTQPSGARLPFRIAKPPVGFSGLSFLRTTSCPGVSLAAAASRSEEHTS